MMQRGASAPRQRVEKHAFPERVIRDDDLIDLEFLDRLLENDRSRQDDVRPTGVHSGKRIALLDRSRSNQRSHSGLDLVATHREVIECSGSDIASLRIHERRNRFRCSR